jgi:hypothetical protein
MEGMYYGGGPKPEEDADVDIGNLLEQTRLDDGTAKGQSILSSLMAGGKDRGLNLIQVRLSFTFLSFAIFGGLECSSICVAFSDAMRDLTLREIDNGLILE